MKSVFDIIKRPIITEKSMQLVEKKVQYTFEVDKKANKVEIKNAVEKAFNVEVTSVNTINVRAKAKKVGKHSGFSPAYKKAIVTLKAGQTIDVFEV
ncbi:MAG TPA: 50S ribosomal protein L23 [Bacilli bacterium]|nr:50S ribosomal protein L23 [Bacilli bacterium]